MKKKRMADVTKAVGLLEEAKELLESSSSDEREEFDNKGEKAQENDKGQQVDANATALEAALSSVEEALDELGNVEE